MNIVLHVTFIVILFGFSEGQDMSMGLWIAGDKINNASPQEVTPTTNKIPLLRDSSLMGRSASSTNSASQPVYNQFSAVGLPAVGFGQGSLPTWLSINAENDGKALFSSADGITMFFVMKSDSSKDDANPSFVFDFGSFPTNGYGVYFAKNAIGMWTGTLNGGTNSGYQTINVNCNELIMATVEIKFKQGNVNGYQRITVNGKEVVSNNITVEYLNATSGFHTASSSDINSVQKGPATFGKASVLQATPMPAGFFKGELAEMIWYPRTFDLAPRADTELYLSEKYWIANDIFLTVLNLRQPASSVRPDPCAKTHKLHFASTGNWAFFLNGRKLQEGVAVTDSSLSLPRTPVEGDVLAIMSSGTQEAAISVELIRDDVSPKVVEVVTDSTWLCSSQFSKNWSDITFGGQYLWRTGSTVWNAPQSDPFNSATMKLGATTEPDNTYSPAAANATNPVSFLKSNTVYCRATIGVAIDRITPDFGVYNVDTNITITGRGFGKPADPVPVVMIGVRRCDKVQRLDERRITCVVKYDDSLASRMTTDATSDDVVVMLGPKKAAVKRLGWGWISGSTLAQIIAQNNVVS